MLNAYAEEQIAKFDTMTTFKDEPEKGFLAKLDWVDGVPLAVAKMTAKGLTQEMVDSWYNDPMQLRVLNPKNKMTKLEDDDGHLMAHVQIGTPMMVSERCIIQTWYNSKCEDGSTIIMSSSQGNEHLYAEHKDKSGKAVECKMLIQYTKLTPIEGGMECISVSQSDPCGMLPGFVKTKMGKRLGENLAIIVDFLINGTIPPPAF